MLLGYTDCITSHITDGIDLKNIYQLIGELIVCSLILPAFHNISHFNKLKDYIIERSDILKTT
jgi:hypothetical protein